jgi:hypothetical protein
MILNGINFDPESMQRTNDGTYWIGDEFGPYLLHFSADGVLLDVNKRSGVLPLMILNGINLFGSRNWIKLCTVT